MTYQDIFIGESGIVVMVSAMLLALVGNLFKKYKRFKQRKDKARSFSLWVWLKDNFIDMVVGFVFTYILVRLMSFFSVYLYDMAGISEHANNLTPQDSVFLVSILIGYYSDVAINKILS